MKHYLLPLTVIITLAGLAALGGSALVWLAAVSGPEPTPAQQQLAELADWIVKGAVGALLGFAGGAGLARLNGG